MDWRRIGLLVAHRACNRVRRVIRSLNIPSRSRALPCGPHESVTRVMVATGRGDSNEYAAGRLARIARLGGSRSETAFIWQVGAYVYPMQDVASHHKSS